MMESFKPDFSLVRKYNRPGPRYTSYPSALYFTDAIPRDSLLADLGSGEGLSLYVHIPFCESQCWFCGCNTLVTRSRDKADAYLDTLEQEMELTLKRLGEPRPVHQLHLGGGTPNFLEPEQINRLGRMLRARFEYAADLEASVELDPRRLTREHIHAFREAGFNRASFGVQDCNPAVQETINRVQSSEENRAAMENLRSEGFESVNIDLIYGLPRQEPEAFARTLDEVLALDPDRFAVFSYAHVPWVKPAQKMLEKACLPEAGTKFSLLKLVIERLSAAGYHYIGMDHFAKPGDELVRAQQRGELQRNFQGYSTHGGLEICAFGVSAISQTASTYRQNEKGLNEWHAAVQAGELPVLRGYTLTAEDKLRRSVIMNIMCNLGVHFRDIEASFAIDFSEHFAGEIEKLKELAEDGLVVLNNDRIQVTDTGRLLVRNIAMTFDAYLKEGQQAFSRTV